MDDIQLHQFSIVGYLGREQGNYGTRETEWNGMLFDFVSCHAWCGVVQLWEAISLTLRSSFVCFALLMCFQFKLSLLTSLVQFSPLCFMHWLPHGRKELEELASRPYSGSALGGRIFLTVLFGSMTITLLVSILNITRPGWAGGS